MGRRIRRGFEAVTAEHRAVRDKEPTMPRRATKQSAAYDLFAQYGGTILPGEKKLFATDVKVYMQSDEVFILLPRSSQGIKLDVMLANTAGVIDADFCDNPENDGNIGIFLRNLGTVPVEIKDGERVAQGMFMPYMVADFEPNDLPERIGGVGSTGR